MVYVGLAIEGQDHGVGLMLEIDGLKGGEARSCGKGVRRRDIAKNGLVIAFLLFAMVALSSAQLEYEPGERAAEWLFERGLGGPWIISERHPEMYPREEDGARPWTSELSWYAEYFSMTSFPGMEVERYYLSGTPEIYRAGPAGQPLAYSQPPAYGGGMGLWIFGSRSWTEYAIVPQGSYLRLLALHPAGGAADLYEITPSNRLVQKRLSLYPGYNLIAFRPGEAGRYLLLLFSVEEKISNVVMVDVRGAAWPVWSPGPGREPPVYGLSW